MGKHVGELIGVLSEVDHLIGELSVDNQAVVGELSIPDMINVGEYDGDYTVIPKAEEAILLETKGLIMKDDLTVTKVPYYETSNAYGITVYIASEVD